MYQNYPVALMSLPMSYFNDAFKFIKISGAKAFHVLFYS